MCTAYQTICRAYRGALVSPLPPFTMASLIGSTVLSDAENIIVVPLSTITMIYTNLAIYFVTWEYNPETDEEREICCTQLTELPSHLDPQLRVPILFEVIGQISPDECFLTADGYKSPESSGEEDELLATCWIETPETDYISQLYWLGIAPAVQEIAHQIPTDVDTSRLLTDEQGEDIRLQVSYQPPAGQVRQFDHCTHLLSDIIFSLLRPPCLCTTVAGNAKFHHALPRSRSDNQFG